MPCVCYAEKQFQPATLEIINHAIEIIDEYVVAGFDLTLRQLYYQFVSRDLLENSQKSYNRLGSIINDARLAGYIDWHSLVDRTRNLQGRSHWISPADIIESAADSYGIDLWKHQEFRPEVWIEKDALVGVIEQVCTEFDVPYFSCRGYTSQSEMWRAAQRLRGYIEWGQKPVIIHLGDHDPSGIDMSRDIESRLNQFLDVDLERCDLGYALEGPLFVFDRIALNRDQIDTYNPPPNFAKLTDSRIEGYKREHGLKSWELDALEPSVMVALIRDTVTSYINKTKWKRRNKEEQKDRVSLTKAASRWTEVEAFLKRKQR